jgi:hypothetical protein
MQNKANFQKAKMSVNPFIKKDYENERRRRLQKNKANSKPISTSHLPPKV